MHGGMAQNVGPILNMVTEKYLLRSRDEWHARAEALAIFESLVEAVDAADVRAIGGLTTRNWEGPLKGIIPWVSNQFTESIIREARATLGDDFWGFLMLGGMSGGGMAFFVAPGRRAEFLRRDRRDHETGQGGARRRPPLRHGPGRLRLRGSTPRGPSPTLVTGADAMMPSRYYTLQVPRMIAAGTATLDPMRKSDIDHFATHCGDTGELLRVFRTMINHLFPVTHAAADPTTASRDEAAEAIRAENGFDAVQHDRPPRGPPARADRARPQPPAGRRRHPRRRGRRPDLGTRPPAPPGRRARRGGVTRGRGGRRLARGRRRQPLDHRGRGGQGGQSRSSCSPAGIALPRDPPGQDPQGPGALRQADPPRRDHELPDAFGHRATPLAIGPLRPRRPGLPLARPVDRPAPRPHGPRPNASSGRKGPTRRSTRTSRRSATPADARSWNGRGRRGRAPTTWTTSPSSDSTPPGTSTRSRTCSATGSSPG